MKINYHIVYLLIIVGLSISCCFACNREIVVEKEIHTSDTLVVHKIDTFIQKVPKYIDRIVERVDTLYLDNGSSFPLEYERKRYFEKDMYDLWIEGYDTKLSSIMVFPKTEYVYVTNTIEKQVELSRWHVYGGLDLDYRLHSFSPSASLYVTTPKRWLLGARVGYANGGVCGGLTIAYKIK